MLWPSKVWSNLMSTPLILSASRLSWSAPPHHGSGQDAHRLVRKWRKTVLRRDDFVCQGCGWRSESWQELHHRNDNHSDFNERNLETLCPLCHQVFHLPTASLTRGGVLVWLPEIEQASLNLMCIGLFVAQTLPSGPWAGVARNVYGSFEQRSAVIANQLGPPDPAFLAQLLVRLPPERYRERAKLLDGIRLLPYPSRFQGATDYWRAAYFKDPPPDQWMSRFKEVMPEQVKGKPGPIDTAGHQVLKASAKQEG